MHSASRGTGAEELGLGVQSTMEQGLRVIAETRRGLELADERRETGVVVRAGDQHRLVANRATAKVLLERLGHYPYAQGPEHVGVNVRRDRREDRDPISGSRYVSYNLEHARIAGAESRIGHPVVDHEHPGRRTHRELDRPLDGVGIGGGLRRTGLEHVPPPLDQLAAVREAEVLLEPLGRAPRLEVTYDRAGLVEHDTASLGDPQAEVDVLAVGRKVAFVEATELFPRVAPDQEGESAAIVDATAKS